MVDRALDLADFVDLVGEVVGVGAATAEANFFDLGGDSVTAAHLCILVEERWDLALDPFAIIAADDLNEIYDSLGRWAVE